MKSKNESFRNNVTRLLESRKVRFVLHQYAYGAGGDAGGAHSAEEVAAAIGLPAAQVFKTLVALSDEPRRKPMLVVVPAPATLELRSFAKQVGAKKVRMATHAEAEALTGLQTGGISALALTSKGFDVWLDRRAAAFSTIAVSAGERGANVELAVADFVSLVRARWVELGEEAGAPGE